MFQRNAPAGPVIRWQELVLMAASLCFTTLPVIASPPDIVLIVADDLGWADVGFHGSDIATPNLDVLAQEGLELSRFYATPSCTSTRAAIMTARNPYRLGLAYSTVMPWSNNGIHPEERLLPEALRDAGYQTGMFGKWHLGHAQETYLPRSRGFDHFYGHLLTEVGYSQPFQAQGGRDFQRNGSSVNGDGYETFMLVEEVDRWLGGRDDDRPVFIYLPFLAPHTPLTAPQHYLEQYAEMKDARGPARSPVDLISERTRQAGVQSKRPVYAAAVTAMDHAIGQLRQTLAKHGRAENTLLLFLSDNGGQAIYGAGGADNTPYRGGKGEVFEGGIRTVALMHWPGALAAGETYTGTVSALDLFPTLAAAAGIDTGASKPLDGMDQWPALSGKAPPASGRSLFFAQESPGFGSLKHGLIEGDWKLVELVEQDLDATRFVHMLFNLAEDPYEYHDIAGEHPERVARMAGTIREWRGRYPVGGTRSNLVPPPGWRAPLDWSTYPTPVEILQAEPAPGMGDQRSQRVMDRALRGRATLIYE